MHRAAQIVKVYHVNFFEMHRCYTISVEANRPAALKGKSVGMSFSFRQDGSDLDRSGEGHVLPGMPRFALSCSLPSP